MSTARREIGLAVGLCLLGSLLLLWGTAQTWVSLALPESLTLADLQRTGSGAQVAPGLRTLGVLGLSGVVAIAATRRTGRVAVGVLLLLAGLLATGAAARWVSTERLRTWALGHLLDCTGLCVVSDAEFAAPRTHQSGVLIAVCGGLLLAAAGAIVALRGKAWPALGTSYAAPAVGNGLPAAPATDKGVWDALDRGDDPTA